MKKCLSIFLLISILASISIPASANNQDGKSINLDSIVMESAGHGEFRLSNASSYNNTIDVEYAEKGDFVLATPTDSRGIYQVSDNKFLIQAYDETYLLSDKYSIDIDNFDRSIEILVNNNIADDAIAEMQAIIEKQKELKNDEFYIEIFVPSTVNSAIDTRGTSSNSYYTYRYDGYTYKMKDANIKYVNLTSSMVEFEGTNAKAQAEGFVNVVVSAVGTVSKTISVFGVGKSLYDLYKAAVGPVDYGRGGDRTNSLLVYDRIVKRTSVYQTGVDEYIEGCVSQKVWLNRLDTYQFYGATGVAKLLQPSINKEHFSENFNNPSMAILMAGPIYFDEPIRAKLYNTTVVLVGEN